jgi:putative peptidoglycan lipid II flippase
LTSAHPCSSIVFIPIFLEHIERDDGAQAWNSFSVIANFVLLLGGLGVALLMLVRHQDF